jgi:hypothetical protein
MKATVTSFELRFGNFIKYYDEIVQVYGTKGLYVFVPVPVIGEDDKEYTLEEVAFPAIEPIPLTPELLEKCGFVRSQDEDENSLTLVNGRKTFKWVEGNDDDYFLIYQTDCGLDYNTAFELEHLHQLQNLYYALTGEELEINL